MRIGVMFPSEESFYEGMGKELYENYDSVKKLFEKTRKISGVNLKEGIIYSTSCKKWNFITRSIAVLTVSVSMYQLWKQTYNIEPVCYMGDGVGLLSALVCAGDISFDSAIKFLVNNNEKFMALGKTSKKVLSYFDGEFLTDRKDVSASVEACLNAKINIKDFAEYSSKHKLNCVIEIGPGYQYTKHLNNTEDALFVYLDSSDDNNYILENFEYGKYFNKVYILKRLLGIAVCTQNFNFEDGFEEEVIAPYNKIHSYIEEYNRSSMQGNVMEITDDVLEECVALLKRILAFKLSPKNEIKERIEMLQNETAMDFREKFKDYIELK